MRHCFIISSFLLLLSCILLSCSTERNLARDYVKNHKGDGIMLSATDYLYKENLGAFVDTVKYPERDQQDSVAYFSSSFMQYVSDSIFLTLFTNRLIEELTSYGFDVMLDHAADKFLDSKKPTWIVQLAQLQLEENYTPKYVYGYDDEDQEYYQEYRVNSVGLNSWLEVNRLNSEEGTKQMLYLSGYIEDPGNQIVSLDFYNGKFYFTDTRDTISISDIYLMASLSAKKHAELLFDYFMNDYIRRNLKNGGTKRKEMHYNHKLNMLDAELIERFEVVK